MSAAAGVPLTRELLQALENLACGYTGPDWRAVKDACTAALASDAGTPEGERVEGWTGKPCPCPNCGAIRNERDAHFCSSTRAASAALDESGAAAPDAELDRLLWRLNGLEQDIGIADERGDTEAKAEHVDTAVGCMAAIHAHVEQVKREAREGERRTVAAEAMRIVRRMEAQRGVASEFPAPAPKEGL